VTGDAPIPGKPHATPTSRSDAAAPAARRIGAEKVLPLAEVLARLETRRRLGQRIVLTNGCFDLLHPGHVWGLEDAAAHGDCLVVALNSDASVRRLKGASRPIIDEHGRAAMLAALESVDYVTLFDQDTPLELVRAVRPDILIKGGTYTAHEVVGREIVESYGGTVLIGCLYRGWSTTDLAGRIRNSDSADR
jgi:rfaE bifunctional protein nucleotidyltransferase chain/domain